MNVRHGGYVLRKGPIDPRLVETYAVAKQREQARRAPYVQPADPGWSWTTWAGLAIGGLVVGVTVAAVTQRRSKR